MKIYFVRHAESQANLLHVISNRNMAHGLTDNGRAQAKKLAVQLQSQHIDRLYSSPLQRAVETSEIIGEVLGIDYETNDGLREFDCGIAEGRSDKAAWALWQAEYDAWVLNQDYDYKIEGGEDFWTVHQRFVSFTNRLLASYAGTSAGILCIGHGGLYSVMFPQVMKNVTPAMMMKYGFDHISCIVAEPAPGGMMCVEWNGAAI